MARYLREQRRNSPTTLPFCSIQPKNVDNRPIVRLSACNAMRERERERRRTKVDGSTRKVARMIGRMINISVSTITLCQTYLSLLYSDGTPLSRPKGSSAWRKVEGFARKSTREREEYSRSAQKFVRTLLGDVRWTEMSLFTTACSFARRVAEGNR